jgi:hypothetical protein
MKTIFYLIIIVAILGLYVDIRNVDWYCNSASYQKSIIVQTIIPFRVDRETWIIGYGEKINNYPVVEFYPQDADIRQGWSMRTHCPIYEKNGKPWNGDNFHYIDLLFWK